VVWAPEKIRSPRVAGERGELVFAERTESPGLGVAERFFEFRSLDHRLKSEFEIKQSVLPGDSA
jgi:hypothetical protein